LTGRSYLANHASNPTRTVCSCEIGYNTYLCPWLWLWEPPPLDPTFDPLATISITISLPKTEKNEQEKITIYTNLSENFKEVPNSTFDFQVTMKSYFRETNFHLFQPVTFLISLPTKEPCSRLKITSL